LQESYPFVAQILTTAGQHISADALGRVTPTFGIALVLLIAGIVAKFVFDR
jgi:hypothetical protein